MFNIGQVAKSTEDLKVQVKELIARGEFTLDDPDRLNNVEMVIPTNIVGEMFHSNVEKIRECLMRNEVSRIGICGMGGVGKTTVVQYVHNKVLENCSTFGNVYWVTVSRDCSIYKLQNEIANVIAKDFLNGVHDQIIRAGLLAQALKKKGKFVLFLDDMWDNFDLYKVGILGNVECKLVLTARSKDVCRRMGCDENNIIQVDPLSEENAWNLFVEYYSTHYIQPHIEEIAKQVVKECSGLPLGIITLARSMRETDDIREWKNILRKLKRSEVGLKAMEDDVFRILRFSYDRLDDSQLQECLLYCATYPEDYQIPRDELIWGFIDKGLIKYEEHTMEEMMDEGRTILNKLERACLLTSTKYERMKMHDLIRDMALQVSGSKFMVKAGIGLTDFPSDEKAWTEDIEVVSLMDNDLSEISYTPNCQNLSVMLLQDNFHLRRIPDDFFERIHGLTVFDLSHTSIEVLPKSISYLIHLTALILRGCESLKDVPSLENLTAIRRLDLSWTEITEIPSGLEKLVNLKYLNLEDCLWLEQFPTGLLPKLSHLQYLNLKGCTYYTSAIELMSLKNLEIFRGRMSQISDFNAYVKHMKTYHRLKKYSIVVGGSTFSTSQLDRNVSLKDCEISNCHMEFPKDVQSLRIQDCVLKTSGLKDCAEIRHLFSSPSSLLLLEDLDIETLRNLYSLFGRGTGSSLTPVIDPQSSFSNLKIIDVSFCPEIKYLFTTKEIRYLPNLEDICVWGCPKLENIIMDVYEVEEDASTNICSLPKLNRLRLKYLPKLESICSEKRVSMSCVSLKEIIIYNCPVLKRMSLSLPINLSPTSFLDVDVDDKQMWESLEWDHPDHPDTTTSNIDKVVIEEEKCPNKSESANKEESKEKGKERKSKRKGEAKANEKKVIFGMGEIGEIHGEKSESIVVNISTHERMVTPELRSGIERWELRRYVVFGGLIESITSLVIVTSAASANISDGNIIALALTNLITGFFIIRHGLSRIGKNKVKKDYTRIEVKQTKEVLGDIMNYLVGLTVAILSLLFFGLVPPLVYALSFPKTGHKDVKIIAAAGASLLCTAFLAIQKTHIQKPKNWVVYVKTCSCYISIGIGAFGLSYFAGTMFGKLADELQWIE